MLGSTGRTIGGAALAVIVAIALLIAVALGSLLWRYVIAEPKGKVQAQEQIQSGSSRIAAYNHFFDLCAAVQSDEAAMASLNEELGTNPRVSRREQIQASLTALRSSRAEKINQYNADARKDYTIGQFRSSGLPFTIGDSQETTCTV